MKIEVWSDFVCPFCYMGERKFELALEKFPHKEEVELEFKSFELNMDKTDYKGKDIHQIIADKYGISYEQAKENNDRIVQAASEVGLDYRFDILKLNNTKLAHEIAQYAKLSQKGNDLVKRFFKGYFEQGIDIGDQLALLDLAKEVGLDTADLQRQLDNGSLEAKVREDEEMAAKLGINSVPYFVFDDKYAVSGAQNPEIFLEALTKAYKD